MTIETLKSPNQRNRNSISVIQSKFLFVLRWTLCSPLWKLLTRDVTSHWQAGCTTHFLGDTFPLLPEWSFWSFAALPSTVLYRPQPIVYVSVLNTNKWINDYTCNIHLWHFLLFSWKCFLQNVQKRKKRREEKVGNQRKFVKKKKRSFTRCQCIPENQMVEKFQSIFSFKIIIS